MTRLEEIREREQKANKGPWERLELTRASASLSCFDVVQVDGFLISKVWTGGSLRPNRSETKANADFIANARDDIPYLLARIAALEAAAEPMRELVSQSELALHYLTALMAKAGLDITRIPDDHILRSFARALEATLRPDSETEG